MAWPTRRFSRAGAQVLPDRDQLLTTANLVLRVRKPTSAEVALLKPGAVYVSFLDPFNHRELIQQLAARGVSAFSL